MQPAVDAKILYLKVNYLLPFRQACRAAAQVRAGVEPPFLFLASAESEKAARSKTLRLLEFLAERTGLEPAPPGVTGR
ncbi:hypothetical protein, partial [Bordetella holmesii]|uniref:hypothetical protein n=1 Tax=Bordetella holmesii TaxID=35814 RepID=UPI0027DC2B3C